MGSSTDADALCIAAPACPHCAVELTPQGGPPPSYRCPTCGFGLQPRPLRKAVSSHWYEAVSPKVPAPGEGRDGRIRLAYRFYSLVYGPLALLSLYLIWRGRLRPLIAWYRESYEEAGSQAVLDVAVGDGALARLACRKLATRIRALFLDLSRDMLRKATRKLRALIGARFLVANAEEIPLPVGSAERVFCFGGLHVFSDRRACLRGMARVLRLGGKLRGSIVLRPRGRISRYLCQRVFRPLGLLTHSPPEAEFRGDLAATGFELTTVTWNGRMMLFEAERVGDRAGDRGEGGESPSLSAPPAR